MKFIFSLILLSTFFFSCTEKVSTRDKIPALHSKERLANKIEEDSLGINEEEVKTDEKSDSEDVKTFGDYD